MNIPTVQMTVIHPYSYMRGATEINGIEHGKRDVSLEYAAFLNDIGELNVESYVSEVHEALSQTKDYKELHDKLTCMLREELADEMMEYYIRRKLDIATQANDKTWEDFV